MAEKTAATKMLIKEGMALALLNPPTGYPSALGLPPSTSITDQPQGADAIVAFASKQADMESAIRSIQPHIGSKTLVWLAYPKGSVAAGFDLNRDTIWAFLLTLDLRAVSQVSLDSYWSALRVRP